MHHSHRKYLFDSIASHAAWLAENTQPPTEAGAPARASAAEVERHWTSLSAAVQEIEAEFHQPSAA